VNGLWLRAAGAERKYAPAALDRPRSVRLVSFVRAARDLRSRATPQLIR
jgi:hypothetical protein